MWLLSKSSTKGDVPKSSVGDNCVSQQTATYYLLLYCDCDKWLSLSNKGRGDELKMQK